MLAFDAHQDVKVAGSLIRTAAIACLVHQKWSDRAGPSKACLLNLKRALMGILWDPFLHPLSFAPDITQQTFSLLITLCIEHKQLITFLVDMIAELISLDRPAGLAILSKLVSSVKINSSAATGGKGAERFSNDCDVILTIIADFAVRKDAILIVGLYLGKLLPVLQSERAAVRKHLFDIIGGCLAQFQVLSPHDQQAIVTLHSFILRDRDATCRVKALTNLCTSLKDNSFNDMETCQKFIILVLGRILDKSKVVRLKALQSLEAFLSTMRSPYLAQSSTFAGHIEAEVATKVSKLLIISADSPYYCKETSEAAGNVLCLACIMGPAMADTLDVLLSSEHSSARLPVILKVLHFHLYGYDQWLHFLASRSEESMSNVHKFMVASKDEQKAFVTNVQEVLKKACLEVQYKQLNGVKLLGSLRMISALTSIGCGWAPNLHDFSLTIVTILNGHIKDSSKLSEDERQLKNSIIKWALKTLAIISKENKNTITREIFEFLEEKLVDVYNAGIEGCVDCIYSMKNPYTLTKKILKAYEERLQVLDSAQPLKLLQGYVVFIGDLSKSYQFACNAFIKCLREAQKQSSVPASSNDTLSDFDYLQQEEQKAQEEDAVLRFARMLLDGDSIPGCYVPFLHELASSVTLPASLRTSAIQSLGQYMLSSNDLAEKYRSTLEILLQSEMPEIKRSALHLAEKLILAFPNDYLPVLAMVLSLLHDDKVKDTAFSVYANLILEKKFKLDVLLGPICNGICDNNEKISVIAVFLLKRLVHEAGKSKHKLLISLWNHCTNEESHKKLARVLAENILDAIDLQSDELSSSALQILALGHDGVAFLTSFLHPSFKVLQTLDSYLSSCPPKVNLKANSEAAEYLSQFVKNCRRLKAASAAEKELVRRLLEKLHRKGSRKRKSQVASLKTENSYISLADYEKAIQSFKQCEITSSLWELFRHDI